MPTDNTQEGVEQVDRWPVVKVTGAGRPIATSTYAGSGLIPKGTQDYYPSSSPNVLSPDEARLYHKVMKTKDYSTAELRSFEALIDRLSTYAEEN